MKKILNIKEAIRTARKLRNNNKTIVIAGGFFDILHFGHIKFLEKSKKYGDYLFVLLEEDSKATKEKGKQRPINSQEIRAKILAGIQWVDYIVKLKNMTNNGHYDKIMVEMRPNVISTTYGDQHVNHKKRQAALIHAKLIYAIRRIEDYSTTKYVNCTNKK
jgi:rfaE bifunctional protein nucleotidyltransferase chain/domain